MLTVLDFVGHQRKEFRFDHKLRALTGETRRGLEREIEQGFPFLPSGCQIVMDKQAQTIVLDNMQSQVANRWQQIVAELRSYGDLTSPTFLHESGIELPDILRRGQTLLDPASPRRRPADARLARLAKASCSSGSAPSPTSTTAIRAPATAGCCADDAPPYADLCQVEQRLARMLFFSLWPVAAASRPTTTASPRSAPSTPPRAELDAGHRPRVRRSPPRRAPARPEPLADVPLRVHARISAKRSSPRSTTPTSSATRPACVQGVAYSEPLNVDAFFVTLKKSEADYSPTTMYRDYPISPTLFHWESQNDHLGRLTDRPALPQRLEHCVALLPDEQKDEYDTAPYLFLGPAALRQSRGRAPDRHHLGAAARHANDFFTSATVAAG